MKNLDTILQSLKPTTMTRALATYLPLAAMSAFLACAREDPQPARQEAAYTGRYQEGTIQDVDGDGHANKEECEYINDGNASTVKCVYTIDDCNDNDPTKWREIPAFVDLDEDGYGAGYVASICIGNRLPSIYSLNDRDCDDRDSLINPSSPDICDGKDNDCSPLSSDGSHEQAPLNHNQRGVCWNSHKSCVGGMWVKDYNGAPGYEAVEESCDGLDNDCNGEADAYLGERFYLDLDGDGFGDAARSTIACTRPGTEYVGNGGDCNDRDATANPIAIEICNSIDDNCNNNVDEDTQDCSKILFLSYNRLTDKYGIRVMNADGNNQRILFSHYDNLRAIWCGDKIAYQVEEEGRENIVLMDADGSDAHSVARADYIDSMDCSPSGRYLVFSGDNENSTGLFLVDTSTGSMLERQIGDIKEASFCNEQRIAWAQRNNDGDFNIHVKDIDSGSVHVSPLLGEDIHQLDCVEDTIVYSQRSDFDDGNTRIDTIYLVRMMADNLQQIAGDAIAFPTLDCQEEQRSRYSVDGLTLSADASHLVYAESTIAYCTDESPVVNVAMRSGALMDVNLTTLDTAVSLLPSHCMYVEDPSLSSDGITFAGDCVPGSGAESNIYAVNRDGSNLTLLLTDQYERYKEPKFKQ